VAVRGWPTVLSTRATREGLRLKPCTWGDAPVTKVDRIGGQNRAGWRWGGGLRAKETPRRVSAVGRVFGLRLSKPRSAHRPEERIEPGTTHSSTTLLQQVIDGEVLLDQRQAAPQGVSGLLRREPLKPAVSDAIVLAEVTVNRFEAVVRLARHDVRLLPLGIALPANDPLVRQTRPHIVEGGATGNDGLGGSLVFRQHMSDSTVVGIEQLGEVAIGEQATLLVSLLAQSEGLLQQPLGSGEAIDALVGVLRGGEVQEHGNQIGIGDALALAGWVTDADGHPQGLSVGQVVLGAHVLEDDLEDQISTQLTDARSADARELLGDPVGEGIPQGLLAERAEFLAEEVGLATHGRAPHQRFFFCHRRNRA
jgi:hypothetical protein